MIYRSLFILPLLALSACLTAPEITPREYYALSPALSVIHGEPLDKTLGVRPLAVAKPFGTSMAYMDAPHALAFRQNQEWAEKPSDTVTRALIDALAASGRFKDVGNAAEMAHPDYKLTGELRNFVENRATTPPTAEIEVRIEVRESFTPRVLWAGTLSITEEIQGGGIHAFTQAMNRAVERAVEEAAIAITAAEL